MSSRSKCTVMSATEGAADFGRGIGTEILGDGEQGMEATEEESTEEETTAALGGAGEAAETAVEEEGSESSAMEDPMAGVEIEVVVPEVLPALEMLRG